MTNSITQNKIESIKVVLLGNSGVGKTCITNRYINDEFNKDSESTNGASYQQKMVTIGNKTVQLDLWDTAGQEKYRSFGKLFYKNAYIIIFVYDITVKETFNAIKEVWYDEVKKNGEKYTIFALVGNKSDLYEKEEVNEKKARAYAKEIGATFMLVSAQNGSNINNLFDMVVNLYLGDDFQPKVQEIITEQKRCESLKLKKNAKTQTHKKKKCSCLIK